MDFIRIDFYLFCFHSIDKNKYFFISLCFIGNHCFADDIFKCSKTNRTKSINWEPIVVGGFAFMKTISRYRNDSRVKMEIQGISEQYQ